MGFLLLLLPLSCSEAGDEGEGELGEGVALEASAPLSVRLPAKIEAEDFVDFEDTTSQHFGNCRSGPVDMQTISGINCYVGWTASGEWLEYLVDVPSAASYDLTLNLASANTGKRVSVSVDGRQVGTRTSPSAGWGAFRSRMIRGLELGAGDHLVRVTFLDGSADLDFLHFQKISDIPEPEPVATCGDGVQNQGEQGVDCGGPCAASCQTSQAWVYSGPTSYRSSKYRVKVTSGGQQLDSFVYQDQNKHVEARAHMTDFNHWTTFSFEGAVEIEVEKLSGNLGSCSVHPKPRGVSVQVSGSRAKMTLERPEKLWLECEGEAEHPLFIFADPKEVDVPAPNAKNVVYFGPGVHEIGKHYEVKANTTYYLAGGAYLKGSMKSASNASNIKIRGRGVLSGENIPHCGYQQCGFDRTAILLGGSAAQGLEVEGITIINSGQYAIQAYGGKMVAQNLKVMGWWHETDGWVAGNDSVLKDSFFKVYDDVVKLYFERQRIENLVIYKQHNGAVFQLGWGSEKGSGADVDSIYVVQDETYWNQQGLEGNRAFLNCASGNSQNLVSDIDIANVWFDGNVSYLLGLRTLGRISGVQLSNVRIAGAQIFKSYLNAQKIGTTTATISDVKLSDVRIGEQCVASSAPLDLRTSGAVSGLSFQCP